MTKETLVEILSGLLPWEAKNPAALRQSSEFAADMFYGEMQQAKGDKAEKALLKKAIESRRAWLRRNALFGRTTNPYASGEFVVFACPFGYAELTPWLEERLPRYLNPVGPEQEKDSRRFIRRMERLIASRVAHAAWNDT